MSFVKGKLAFLPLKYSRLEHATLMPPEPTFLKGCAVVCFADTIADKESSLPFINTPFLGLSLRHAGQIRLPADVIDQHR